MVALNFALNVTLIWPLGALGLAVSSAVSGSCQALLLLRSARGFVAGGLIDGDVRRSWARTAALTVTMAVAVWAATRWSAPTDTLAAAGVVAVGVTVGGAVVFGGGWLLNMPEVRLLIRRAGRRAG